MAWPTSSGPTQLPQVPQKVPDWGYGTPSLAQGTKKLGAWEFTSAFDGGNALWCSWFREEPAKAGRRPEAGDEADVPTFHVEIARDCHGLKNLEKPKASWFHFGVTPERKFRGTVKFVVHGMCEQRDLFAAGYRPWVSAPSQPRWRRIEGSVEVGQSRFFHWQCGWRYTFDGTAGMTRFAFCHPYSYSELMAWLDRLEADLGCPKSELPAASHAGVAGTTWDWCSDGANIDSEIEFLTDGRLAWSSGGSLRAMGTWCVQPTDPSRIEAWIGAFPESHVLRLEGSERAVQERPLSQPQSTMRRRAEDGGGLRGRCIAALRELCIGFADAGFQARLKQLRAEHAAQPVRVQLLKAQHCLTVQREVLPRHGFRGSLEGVADLTAVLGPWFGMDEEVTGLMFELDRLTGDEQLKQAAGGAEAALKRAPRRRAQKAFLQRFGLAPEDGLPELDPPCSASSSSSEGEAESSAEAKAGGGKPREQKELCYFESRDWHDDVPKTGTQIYFHRQTVARTSQGRCVELLTITEAVEGAGPDWPREELPEDVLRALGASRRAALAEPPFRFPGRQVCFFSGRVHPGETPGQFACHGFLQFILSDDPRAAELRRQFVFKVVPMLNPDGVAWGHYRTSACGFDLNRCYRNPTPEQHEGVFAVKALLLGWAERGELLFYMDSHGHAARRGCFLFGNNHSSQPWSSEDALLWNLAYVHSAQLNCPHLDIDACEWSRAVDPKKGRGDREDAEDEVDETSRSDSGRAQIGACCRLYHAYTLECNYHISRTVRPVPEVPGLPPGAYAAQALQAGIHDGDPTRPGYGKRPKPMPYGPKEWAAVGEALAVALLDLHCRSAHSRLILARPPKPLLAPDKDLVRASDGLERLFNALAERHLAVQAQQQPPVAGQPAGGTDCLRRRIFKVIHSPHVYLRDKPAKTGSALGIRKTGETMVALEVRNDGWIQLDPSEVRKLPRKNVSEAYMMVDGTSVGLGPLLGVTGDFATFPVAECSEGGVRAQAAPWVEDVERDLYPPVRTLQLAKTLDAACVAEP